MRILQCLIYNITVRTAGCLVRSFRARCTARNSVSNLSHQLLGAAERKRLTDAHVVHQKLRELRDRCAVFDLAEEAE
eukprot:SAG11_NODE_2254_length_3625_cov_2.484118_3_plen_77_part_00